MPCRQALILWAHHPLLAKVKTEPLTQPYERRIVINIVTVWVWSKIER